MERENRDNNEGKLAVADNDMVIILKKPVNFEGELYEKIDMTGLHDLKAADMVAVNRRLYRNGNAAVTQEVTLEYALNVANIVTGLPLEFFDQIPPQAALEIRGKVISFLFGQE